MIDFPTPLADDPSADAPLQAIGHPLSRVDGPEKVRGRAPYAADFGTEGMAWGVVVGAAIACGRITAIDTTAALAVPGVLEVFTHENRPRLAWFDRQWKDDDSPQGTPYRPLEDEVVRFAGQPVALVVATSFEAARHAAALVAVQYEATPPATDLRAALSTARAPKKFKGGLGPPPPRGDADAALAGAPVRIAAEYELPAQHHNPMELFATTVFHGEGGVLTVHDKTQGVTNSAGFVRRVFGLADDHVTVLSPFVGGAFGAGLRPQLPLFMAVLAATALQRSVQVVLTRPQMFAFGHRPAVVQRLSLGASEAGQLQAIVHETDSETSRFEDYTEPVVNWSAVLYRCENVRTAYNVVPLDLFTPLDMRAPGAAHGVFALECAMDELAHALRLDPVALRLLNHAEHDQVKNQPFSSNELRTCLRAGAERFGWADRTPEPRARREGRDLIGWGMACGVWDAMQMPASARATLHADGTLDVASGTADIGTGTATVMTQIACEALGLAPEGVRFKLGDSTLPKAPLEGGSWTVSSVGTAVKGACDRIADRLFALARSREGSPFAQVDREDAVFERGHLGLKGQAGPRIAYAELLRAADLPSIEETASTLPNLVKQHGLTMSTHSAVFAEVAVDEDLGTVRVRRVVSAIAAGRIVNPKTARSQIVGGIVWGIGAALEEESLMDPHQGRFMNHNLAEYHLAVHADVPRAIDVLFVDEHDTAVNPLGVKGVGEIGLVGVSAAIANAVFHATGRRVRALPITPDKLL